MPELPEVEITTKGLREAVVGLVIKDVWTDLASSHIFQREAVGNPKYFRIFKKEITGRKIISVERRAKNILINLNSGKTILVHLKMTGHLLFGKYKFAKNRWTPDYIDLTHPFHDPYNRFVHVVFTFSNGEHLAFSDARKFGKITLLDTKIAYDSKHLNNIGPEPLDKQFTITNFKLRISKKPNGKVKTVLMDQGIIAGIGNIYSDEILWKASVHPELKVSELIDEEIKLIFQAIKEILKKGIDFGGDSMSDYRNIHGLPGKFQLHHEAYRRTGEKCRKKGCKGIIKRKIVNGRSAHFCSAHQR
ncbi:DNA-formamidopyrimidine glycosylase [Candidatus Nomurabacteria bacterium RIFCSPLOWO2_01_FULL_40_18]|uniref:DNA-formamidopyrimidine glycosylase n=1 Tax=Candidatus Nomurabacteria bacterium RIFCSPLOWO2_01_FULL_40_18 TaxID=1801773 RepID=A0A1F6XJ37_9BACT|nr:MAG: DNA-formamidopyrimidine glycosylase [Candidatus Nomurabacteria bacterium RIFCSPLOWO2_01_FULL_40_18]